MISAAEHGLFALVWDSDVSVSQKATRSQTTRRKRDYGAGHDSVCPRLFYFSGPDEIMPCCISQLAGTQQNSNMTYVKKEKESRIRVR